MIDNLQLARIRLSSKATYLNRVLWSLQPVPEPKIGTIGVDTRLRLYYNPEYLSGLTVDETVAVLVHEIHHVLRDHCGRAPKQAQNDDWNIAADAEINDDLTEEGYILPGNPASNPSQGGGYIMPACLGMDDYLTAEEYYQRTKQLMDQAALANTPGKGKPRQIAEGQCGSIADDQVENHELSPHDPKNPGVGTLERNNVLIKTAHDILNTKASGTVPGSLYRWAQEHMQSQVDWRRELAAVLRRYIARTRGAVDYSYHRPSTRRSASTNGTEYILPSLYAPSPDIAVVVDTSGSIGAKTLEQALAEVEGILKKADAALGIQLISCDAKAEYVGRVLDARQARSRKLAGGGGTDMGIGIALAESLRAEIIVVITDGLTPWPKAAPKARVIVCLIGVGVRQKSSVPAWAKVVVVPP